MATLCQTELRTSAGVWATIAKYDDDSPTRPITDGRRRRPVGRYYSQKNGSSLPWESRNELHGMYQAEVSSEVERYAAQPHTLRMSFEGEAFTYTPDRADFQRHGGVRIIEIKQSPDASDAGYTRKLELAAHIYESLGWTFEIHDRTALSDHPTFSAIEEIQAYRRTAITVADVQVLGELFGQRSECSLGELTAALGRAGHQKICAMVVRRLISVDLSRPLGPASRTMLERT